MSYGVSYALFNYRVANPAKGLEYDNLRLIRAFERGHDPKSSEAGFILTHVDMVKESSALVSGSLRILNSLKSGQDREEICDAYREMLTGLAKIEACMEGKLSLSSPLSLPVSLFLN
jgi:indoleamine 2,3-dioxygenase